MNAGSQPSGGRLVARRYRLLSQLGRGGMGVVWAGRDEVLDRDIAVKEVTPPPGLDDMQRSQLRERTLREARAAARIHSSAAVTVYDVVEEDGRPWIVMELLPPRTLADVLREDGPLSEREAARIGLRLLDALTAAHAAGVLHRDVKPANVLYDSSGQAVLTDFGIASLEGDASMTTTGMIVGSPGYVAPERALGKSPSPASDWWSLGVTLATAVHGRSPFERDTPLATLVSAVQEPLPDWACAGPLGSVIEGLLRKEPAQRPGAPEIRSLLEEAVRLPATAVASPPAPSPAGNPERTQALSLPVTTPPRQPPPPDPAPAPARRPERVLPPPQDRAASERPRRSKALAVLVFLVVLVAAAVIAAVVLDDQDAGSSSAGEPTSTPQDDSTGQGGEPTPSEEPSDPSTGEDGDGEATEPQPEPEPETDTPPDEVEPGEAPAGYELHEDPAYRVAVPAGWTTTVESDTRTVFSDPASRRYLLVEEGGEPAGDPVEDWESQEPSVAQRLTGYERISIERADYRDFDAADWQFTWEPGEGTVRVRNRAVVDEDQAFALYWSVPQEEWRESRPVFEDIAASFQPGEDR